MDGVNDWAGTSRIRGPAGGPRRCAATLSGAVIHNDVNGVLERGLDAKDPYFPVVDAPERVVRVGARLDGRRGGGTTLGHSAYLVPRATSLCPICFGIHSRKSYIDAMTDKKSTILLPYHQAQTIFSILTFF